MMMRSSLFGRVGKIHVFWGTNLDDLLIQARCELSSLVMQRPLYGMLRQPVSHRGYGPFDLPKRLSGMQSGVAGQPSS